MNGVRRFLTGGGTPTSAQFPTQPPSSSPPPVQSPQATAPLAISAKASWPPSPLQSPTELSPTADSQKRTTAALFLRKDRQKPVPIPSEDSQNTSLHSPQSSRDLNGASPRTQDSGQLSPGPSSPRPLRVTELARKPVDRQSMDVKRGSMVLNMRDDLLVSLLASEAIVDSRGCEILSAEEVEELKKEHQVLSSRLVAMEKKLALETKIRDAALSLSKANASYKNVTKQTSGQLDNANRKVELAQKELWRVSERANEIQRRLLEHRAGVLSYSVRSLEKKMAPPDGESSTSGYSTPNRSAQLSPTPSSVTSATTASSKGRFEHFFAGHKEAVVPPVPRLPPTIAEATALEERLKAATAALEEATAKQSETEREISLLRLEKAQVETTLGMDLQAAEDTISALEREAGRTEELEAQLHALEAEKEGWLQDREELEAQRGDVDVLERRLEVLEAENVELRGRVAGLDEKDREIGKLKKEVEDVKAGWEVDREAWEAEKNALQDGAESKVALTECADALRELMQTHGILLASRDSSLPGLVHSVGKHLDELHAKTSSQTRAEEEWAALRTKLEADVRTGMDKREALIAEVEEARLARDDARAQVRELENQLREESLAHAALASLQAPQNSVEYTGDAASIIALLQPLWLILPSPETRATKLGSRPGALRSGSTPGSPVMGRGNTSLSEMDVRSLKTLYDPRGMTPQGAGTFTVEAFVARVQAIIADDRALIERLIRFAQAHDLLKKNAERAQKLAQESNNALETYQKQVNMLEERHITMIQKQSMLDDEVQQLQETVERLTAEKQELETQAAAQAETCRELSDANTALSARALTLAGDAASAGDSVRKQMEMQLAECTSSLNRAREEIEAMRASQQTQQMALMEELNNMQTENANLRAQLRKK